ncbi:hypothetical protein GCM10010388_66840 [Streptomyces mauvecolor]
MKFLAAQSDLAAAQEFCLLRAEVRVPDGGIRAVGGQYGERGRRKATTGPRIPPKHRGGIAPLHSRRSFRVLVARVPGWVYAVGRLFEVACVTPPVTGQTKGPAPPRTGPLW